MPLAARKSETPGRGDEHGGHRSGLNLGGYQRTERKGLDDERQNCEERANLLAERYLIAHPVFTEDDHLAVRFCHRQGIARQGVGNLAYKARHGAAHLHRNVGVNVHAHRRLLSGGDALQEVIGEGQSNCKRHFRLSIAHAQRCLQRLYRFELGRSRCLRRLVAHSLREDCVHARLGVRPP